jgi:uncharacterized protein (TIGR01777 family)
MRVVITGGTGFLGRPLAAQLARLGYECTVVTRDPARAAACGLPPEVRIVADGTLPAADAVINLAGESVVGLWTPRKRRAILVSRVEGTRRLVAAMRRAKVRPHTLLSASAVGFYGDRPGEALEETSPGDARGSFRAEVCRQWEDAANEADALGVRVINLRIGNVLDAGGGFLGGVLPVFRALGGLAFGAPEAAIPWISREDCLRLIVFALANERWYGPLNLTAPAPVTHGEFSAGLAGRLHRPFLGAVPSALLRLMLGEFSSALLDDQNVVPAKALAAGFTFRHPAWSDWLDATFPAASNAAACQLAPAR